MNVFYLVFKMALYSNMSLYKVCFTICCFISVSAVEYSRTNEGHSRGYLADCPGSSNEAIITPETLKQLYFSVMGPGIYLGATWTPYNYYKIKNLAKHPDIDFVNKKTFMYVPGYLDSMTMPLGRNLGQIYRAMGYNVLIMDSIAMMNRDFPVAARYTRSIGKHAAEMLATLSTVGLDPKKLELVGLSLGGESMSFIAKNYRRITGRNISSLTALDPTGPCFRHLGPDQRLDPSDADFVLSVTTNADGFGIGYPVGQVTFYVNGGQYQPGDIPLLPCTIECSHLRAFSIWISALLAPGNFIGMQCDSVEQARAGDCYKREPMVTNTLDLYTDRSKPGIYYLATSSSYPFALGKRGLVRKHFVTF